MGKEWWAELSPDKKRLISGGGVGAVVLVILYLFVSAGPEVETLPDDLPTNTTNILTGRAPRDLGLDALGNDVRENAAALAALAERMTEQEESSTRSAEEIRATLEALTTGLEDLRDGLQRELGTIMRSQEQGLEGLRREVRTLDDGTVIESEVQQPGTVGPQEIIEQNLFDTGAFAPPPLEPGTGLGPAGGSGGAGAQPVAVSRVRIFGAEDLSPGSIESPHTVYLPAGAIISGVLITGVDVPTGTLARSDPMPALMRVKHDAILPNRYRSDVRECFIIVAAQGDLSSERALMRSESLSCIRIDGRLIEVAVDGWAVGEDGKLGLRGRLVSRSGSIVAKAAAAGFAEALSEIYRPVRIQSFNTQPGSTALFQAPEGSEALSASGYAGIGGGARQLAEYYMDLADQIVPVVEIDAGRRIDLVLLEGVALTIREG